MSQNEKWVIKEIMGEVKKLLESNENENENTT
jgi:hypothetical protein